MYEYFLSLQVYVIGLLFGFYISSVCVKNKYINNDTTEYDKLEEQMIENCKNYMFQFKYIDELNNMDSSMINIIIDKSIVTTLEIPFLNNTIIMFYDTDRGAFCYYTKGDVIYKYLNVACRKYVIENNCKNLYLETEPSKLMNNISTLFNNNLFVKKQDKQLLNKNINKFILCGSLEEYNKIKTSNKNTVNNINIKDFLILSKNLNSF
jgi:hypothetical protein